MTKARRILEAMAQAQKEGRGAVALDGRLIDIASIRQAEVLVAKAAADLRRASLNVSAGRPRHWNRMPTFLDFEKPIAELEGKIEELRHLADAGDIEHRRRGRAPAGQGRTSC